MPRTLTRSYHRIATKHHQQQNLRGVGPLISSSVVAQVTGSSQRKKTVDLPSAQSPDNKKHPKHHGTFHPLPLRLIVGQQQQQHHRIASTDASTTRSSSTKDSRSTWVVLPRPHKMVHFMDDATIADDTIATISSASRHDHASSVGCVDEQQPVETQVQPQEEEKEDVETEQQRAALYRQQVEEDLKRATMEFYNHQQMLLQVERAASSQAAMMMI
ncbi:hypothetical protein ACA910_002666 [Epithemia clementina (nom. ined.)]